MKTFLLGRCFLQASRMLLAAVLTAIPLAANASSVTYQLDVIVDWSENTHPDAFPAGEGDAHFSWLGGATHNSSVSFWQVGQQPTAGMILMAERGVTRDLLVEVDSAIGESKADFALD